MIMGGFFRGFLGRVVGGAAKAAAPRGMEFNERRRRVVSSRERLRVSTAEEQFAWALLGAIVSLLGFLWVRYTERKARHIAALAEGTPPTSLAELRHVLRGGTHLQDEHCEPAAGRGGYRPPPLSPAYLGIAAAIYARVRGRLWVPPRELVVAPFSGAVVAYCQSRVVRLYDEWVLRKCAGR